MNSIDSRIINAVSPVVTTVVPNQYKGSNTEYCVFTYTEMPSVFADSKPAAIRYLVQLHYYLPHRTNPNAKKTNIKNALFNAGFTYPQVINASDNEGQHYVFEFEGIGDVVGNI